MDVGEGVRCHYVDENSDATERSPLLMVHGNPTWSFYWRNVIEGFRDRHRCVAIDHVGCGLSDKPQQYEYNLGRHTANLVQLIDRLDLRDVTLLVHDWGGAIGLGAVVQRPDRFAHLVVFNTGAFPPPFVPLRIRVCRTPWLGALAVRGANAFARAALTMAVAAKRLDPDVRAGLLHPYDNWANRVAINAFVRDIPFTPRHPTWRVLAELENDLKQLTTPASLVWGMRDWCFNPSCLRRFQEILPHAQSHRIESAGHYVVEDAIEQIMPIVGDVLASDEVDEPSAAAEDRGR